MFVYFEKENTIRVIKLKSSKPFVLGMTNDNISSIIRRKQAKKVNALIHVELTL